jgi:quercetin dioxygenase-like cupin family protein
VVQLVDPFETSVSVLEDCTVEVGAQVGLAARASDGGIIVAKARPGVRANVAAVRMRESSKHRGERHPEGDELVYLISGAVGVSFESDDSQTPKVVAVQPGQLVVVPCGMWHRLVVQEPSELLFMTPGRTEIRRSP